MLNAPFQLLPSPVRAVDTMTASVIFLRSFVCAEGLAFRAQAREQRRGSPEGAVRIGLRGDVAHAARDLAQTNLVGVEHGAAAPRRKAIAVEIDDIDVRAALRNAILDDARTFVDQCVNAALDDFLAVHLARRDALLLAVFLDDGADFRVRDGISRARLVAI